MNLNLMLLIVPYTITLALCAAALCVPRRACSIVWRFNKTFGLVSMFLVFTLILSFMWQVAYEHERFHLDCESGHIALVLPGLPGHSDPKGVYIRRCDYGTKANFVGQLTFVPIFIVRHRPQFTVYSLPVMWPLLTIGIPSLILAFRRSIYHRKGHCVNCCYDLTGNVTGICPECGTPIQKEGRLG